MIVDSGRSRIFLVQLSEREYNWLNKQRIDVDGDDRDTLARLLYAAIEPKRKTKKKIRAEAKKDENTT